MTEVATLHPADLRSDQGSALVELIFGISALFVPLAIGIVALTNVHAGASAAETIARETARAFVLGDSDTDAWARSAAASRLAFADAHLPYVVPRITCSHQPCMTPGAHIRVYVKFLVAVAWGTWTVESTHMQIVDPWRAFP